MADYKAPEDVARVYHLMSSAHLMRDYPQTAALAASFLRELASMNARQAERDAQAVKDAAAAKAAPKEEENESPPKRAGGR
jgi:hypothetical protein